MDKLPVDHVINDLDNLHFNWSDVMVGGLQNAVIDDLKIHVELKTIRVLFHTNLNMEFNYVMDGVVLSVFPVFGTGKGELKLKNIIMEMLFIFDIVKDDNGKDIMDLKNYYYGYETVDGIEAYFDNLYNGDKKKSEIFHNIVNESWMIMNANFGKSFQRKITSKIFAAVKIYMRSHPLEELALY
ncbi:uncharacterized protein [Maniola hyperantus]|uniref:uncharacterized protein n=1 Tax=Aphantopus hyperantus TaxID=2795564 RepID=UPI003749460D